MLLLHVFQSDLIVLLDLPKSLVPVLVELLVLHQVGLLHLFPLLGLVVHLFLPLPLKVLYFQFLYPILRHLSLNIFPLSLALLPMLL